MMIIIGSHLNHTAIVPSYLQILTPEFSNPIDPSTDPPRSGSRGVKLNETSTLSTGIANLKTSS